MKDIKKLIQTLAEEILTLMEIESPKVSLEEDENNVFHLGIETKDSGVLIGYHGENIYALQLILGLIVYQKTGQWQRIVVDIGDWRQKREEQLKRMALAAAQKVKFSGESVAMPFLNAAERRIVHLTLSENPDVTTKSEGEARDRRLIIAPKQKED